MLAALLALTPLCCRFERLLPPHLNPQALVVGKELAVAAAEKTKKVGLKGAWEVGRAYARQRAAVKRLWCLRALACEPDDLRVY